MENYVYNSLVEKISKEFNIELSKMDATYNFDNGDEFEIALCHILRKILPNKFGICRGFVVDKSGNKEGDDIIIYDQEKFPTLRFLGENQYTLKEHIPIEAVYAYIEAKYTLDNLTFDKAFEQTIRVKKLCYNRSAVPTIKDFNGKYLFSNEYNDYHAWLPLISNPVYTMIIAKNSVNLQNKKTDSKNEINSFILNKINTRGEKIKESKFYNPDAIIAGNNNTVFCGHYYEDKNGKKKKTIEITKFFTGKGLACYQINPCENIAYGLAVSHLMMALNFIELGPMPWDMIFNTAKMPDISLREIARKELEED